MKGSVSLINLCDIQHNPEIEMLMVKVHEYLGTMGAITHDEEHALYVARLGVHILGALGYPEREQRLAEIAGYLHDMNRHQHGLSGALLAFDLLKRLGMPAEEIATVISAIGNHEENSGYAVSNVAAAVILADKSNVHRSRVRKEDVATFSTHDRVNYAATTSFLQIDPDQREILMNLEIDSAIVSVFDYFEIFLSKMLLCRRAANFLQCRFGLIINGSHFL